jgi:SAM-dependent methyltransferase
MMSGTHADFTAHNIRLDDGTLTKPELSYSIADLPWCQSAKRLLGIVFPGDKSRFRLADLGCLEGGYAVEFARMGFQVLGLEIRESNVAACRYVKARTNLPNLDFVQDDAWNIANYGAFDVIFCCGLLYHLDRPKAFLEVLARATKTLLILQTHFATEQLNQTFPLSDLVENESYQGRWYTEFSDKESFASRERFRWSAWDNWQSFWLRREHLLQAIQDAGFDVVMEQYDSLGGDIAGSMISGFYKAEDRSTFIGMKSKA